MWLSPFDRNGGYCHQVRLGIGFSGIRFLRHSTLRCFTLGKRHTVLTEYLPYSACRHYAKLIEQYGPVVSLRYGKRIVCLVGRCQVSVIYTRALRI